MPSKQTEKWDYVVVTERCTEDATAILLKRNGEFAGAHLLDRKHLRAFGQLIADANAHARAIASR
jgi:hypothetical protein